MSRADQQGTFMDRYAKGTVTADEIDDFVDRWHDATPIGGHQDTPLADYLGMTAEEYLAWVHDATALPEIIRARRERRPLGTVTHK